MLPALPATSRNLPCPGCKAAVLPDDERVDSFHADCYTQWITELYAEYDGSRVKVRARAAGR